MPSHVLVVDDEQQAGALASVLERGGYQVSLARDAQGASATLQAGGVDAVLCAWMLAGGDGVELIRRIRARVRPCPPIIMLGSIDGQEMFEEAFRAGADDYLAQPVEPGHLLARVERCISRYRRAHGFQSPPEASSDDEDGPTQRRRAVSRQTVRLGSQLHTPSQTVPPAIAVGICAGEGGVAAVEQVLAQLVTPVIRHASLVLIVHDLAWHHNDLCDRLAQQLNVHVAWASAGAPLAPGTLYLASPGQGHVVVKSAPHVISMVPPPPRGGACPSADWLFRSLSESFGRFAVGVVLAGEGTDAALGAQLISRGGGASLVQEPDTAQPNAMPLAAVQRVPSARRIPVERLGDTLSRYISELSRQLTQARGGSVA
jgi:chemotaxis response regulator CheB